MGGHSKTSVEVNSEVADNGHHTIQIKNFVQLLLFIRAHRMDLWGNMSFLHKENTPVISVFLPYGVTCA